MMSTSGSASIHSWHMPGPNGPSRITVGGTTSQPAVRDTAYAATSRPASEPAGKSHSGRSPATGLYTHVASAPSQRAVQYRVALDAATSLPSTSSVPWVSSSIARSSDRPVAGWRGTGGARRARFLPSERLRPLPVRALFASADGSVMARPVPVLPRAHVAGGVQRQPAQRARRPALSDDPQRTLGEGPGGLGREPHPQHGGPVRRDLVGQRLHRRLGLLLGLDHHPVRLAVPGQRDGPDPELLHQRKVERAVVGGCRGAAGRRAAGSPEHLVEQLIQPLGQLRHLELLQRDAGDPAAVGRLQVEASLAWLADRSGHEPLRRVIHVERHDPYPCASAVRTRSVSSRASPAAPPGPAPPPTMPSLSACWLAGPAWRRMSPATS